MNCFIVTVCFGCTTTEQSHSRVFHDPNEALAYYRKYAEQAAQGYWFEDLGIEHSPSDDPEILRHFCLGGEVNL